MALQRIDRAPGGASTPASAGPASATHPQRHVPTGQTAGLLFAVLSAASFGLSGSLGRGLLTAGWTPAATVLGRITVAALVLLVPTIGTVRGQPAVLRGNVGLVVSYGLVAVAGCQFAYFSAVARMPVAVALLIEYTSPIGVIVWLWLRHGHRPSWLTLTGTAVAIVGLVLMLGIVTGTHADLAGVGWACVAMIGGATYFVLSARQTELPPLALAGGGLLVGSVALSIAGAIGLVPMAASRGDAVYAPGGVPWWVPLLGLGVVTAAIAYTTGIAAGRRLGSRLASFVALLEVIFAMLAAALLLGERPGWQQLLGAMAILSGVLLVKLGEPAVGAEDENGLALNSGAESRH